MKRGKMKLYIPLAKIPREYKTVTVDFYNGGFRFYGVAKDTCKSWKPFLTVSRPCGSYENGLVNIYKTTKKGVYALKTYFDGCFNPFVCYTRLSAEVVKDIEDLWIFLNEKNKRG